MENVLRALIYDEQVSLTVADTTEIVRKAIALHALSRPSAVILGKFLSAGVLMCAGLKEERGELSVTFQSDGVFCFCFCKIARKCRNPCKIHDNSRITPV